MARLIGSYAVSASITNSDELVERVAAFFEDYSSPPGWRFPNGLTSGFGIEVDSDVANFSSSAAASVKFTNAAIWQAYTTRMNFRLLSGWARCRTFADSAGVRLGRVALLR